MHDGRCIFPDQHDIDDKSEVEEQQQEADKETTESESSVESASDEGTTGTEIEEEEVLDAMHVISMTELGKSVMRAAEREVKLHQTEVDRRRKIFKEFMEERCVFCCSHSVDCSRAFQCSFACLLACDFF